MRNPVSECVTKKWMKKMKGLEQSIFFYFIENPHTHSFLDEQHSPMRPREEFSDLIERLKVLVQENEIALTFKDIDMKDRNGF
jgi:hypothetical protein